MSHPGITRSALCSNIAAAVRPELTDMGYGLLSADRCPLSDDRTGAGAMTALAAAPADLHTAETSRIDRAIRMSTAAAVLAVAGVAAYVSYWHAYAVVRAHGERGITAQLEPATIDGLVYTSSMVILYAARHRIPVPPLARWLLGLGIAATLTANMAQGWSHGPIGAVVAAWPAVSLVGSYELLVWLIRTSGAPEREPSAGRCCEDAARLAAHFSASVAATDSGQQCRNNRDMPGRRRSADQPVSPGCAEPGAEVLEIDRDNYTAVAAYQLSVKAGNPLSERKLAQMFGRTSRRWARARIADARQSAQGSP